MKYFFQLLCLIFLNQTIIANSYIANDKIDSLPFEIYSKNNQSIILYDKIGASLDSISAHLLAEDIFSVTNFRPEVVTDIKKAEGNVIVIGAINSNLVGRFLNKKRIRTGFENQWESYLLKTIANPTKKIKKAFIIAGTNPRGTAYGVFAISKKIGVSPWYWWADVPVKKSEELVLNEQDYYSNSPSVDYRGIFLNDEDWGLQPWAAKTFEPETADIGPKTYAKIFELLLRLNANTIWPAMHPSTKAFFYYPNNAKMASLYNIVIGTSHAEPMLRNNVDEWNEKTFGSFNYKTNKTKVYKYWESRVKEAKNIDAIFSMGMRGVHDSGMEGVKSNDEAVAVLNEVITDQRNLLKKYVNKNVTKIPQALTVYKEVLDLYKNGLNVPEDITLVWTDDNYGYIRALSNSEEQKRSGGGGVYYHASYWGRPHDYLWLSTTSPDLIREEMIKAYNLNNRKIWILNVGDIKPAEYTTQLFLDMAYNADKFQNPDYIARHQSLFYSDIFGEKYAKDISKIKENYYQLAFERKPEYMGWSQTEPITPIFNTQYSALANGDEIQQRINAYENIEQQVEGVEKQLPEELKSTFTQLVSYPVAASAQMNKKFLYRDKALIYAKQGRKSAKIYSELAHQAYEKIEVLTKNYNQLSNGKWQHIMDMKPRELPVFNDPSIELEFPTSTEAIGIAIEDTLTTVSGEQCLPTFYVGDKEAYFIDVYLKEASKAVWKWSQLPSWITINQDSGTLDISKSLEQRIDVSVNWEAWKQAGEPSSGVLKIKLNEKEKNIHINISNNYQNLPQDSFVEKNGVAVMYANHYSKNTPSENLKWEVVNGLGHSGFAMQSTPLNSPSISNEKNAPVLEYELFTETITDSAELSIVALPTHPVTTDGEVRIAVQWNTEPIQIINFKTEGRSNTWKNNVLTNKAMGKIKVPLTTKGKQNLKVYRVDSGVVLDYMVLNTKRKALPHKLSSETKTK
jgi:hypothetical protein